jgi:ribosome-binding protein aMBF1 (putative translation factor)
LPALADDLLSADALRVAAARGRLEASKGADGTWRSSRAWVDAYKASRRRGAAASTSVPSSDDPVTVLAARLRAYRAQRGFSQAQLAERASMDVVEVRRLESGRRAAGIRLVARLARALEVEPHELLRGIDGPA